MNLRLRTKTIAFQHTAARRRLTKKLGNNIVVYKVSTHSRAKAADALDLIAKQPMNCFNTQPREGG